jgi:hypothetical protein
MTDDLLKELDALRHDLEEFKEKWQDDDIWSVLDQAADKIELDAIHIEKLEAALFNIYVAPNDTPFIKAQIDAVLDINEYRQALKVNNDPST